MRRLLIPLVTLVAAGPAATAAPAPAGPDAKAELPVPANALVVVQVRGVGPARERLTKLVEAAAPDLAGGFKDAVDAQFGPLFEGRNLDGLTTDARVFLAVTGFDGLTGDAPEAALLLPVPDYKTFRAKVLTADERKSFRTGVGGVDEVERDGKPVYLVDLAKRGYVAATTNKAVAESLADRFDALTPARIGEPVAAAFLAADAAVYVNLAAVNDKHGDSLRSYRQLAGAILKQGGFGTAGMDPRQLESARQAVDSAFQAVQDGTGFAVGVDFRPDGLAVRVEVRFAGDTASTKLLAGEKPTPLDRLAELPKGRPTYTAGRFGPGVSAAASQFVREYAAAEGDDKAAAAVVKYQELAAGTAWASAGGSGTSLQVAYPQDPAKLAAAHLTALRNLTDGAAYQNLPLKEKPVVKEAEREHGGFALHRATLAVDFDAAAAGIADENLRKAAVESMKRLAPEKPTFWFGTDGKRYVQVAAKDWDAAKGLLDAYLSGKDAVGADPAFAAVRKALPAEASGLYVVEAGSAVAAVAEFLRGVTQAMPAFPGLEVPDAKPAAGAAAAYAGAAVVLTPSSAGVTVFVPVEALKAGRQVVAPTAK